MSTTRKVKIVCTLGPACANYDTLFQMAEAGMNVARFNFSHGDYQTHGANLALVREVEQKRNRPIAALLDTQGPEIRTGMLENKAPVILEAAQKFSLVTKDIEGNKAEVSISHKNLPGEVAGGMDIFIDDGALHLKVDDVAPDAIRCTVMVGGELGNRKGINIPEAKLSVPTLTEKDIKDIKWGIENNMDFIAVSFVRDRSDIMEVRKVIEDMNGSMRIIAKIETRQAVHNLEEIVQVVDGMMVARGDLGVEMPTEDVPLVQKRIVELCRTNGKPVIVATQMLDSMIRNPRPTRAEATDVANAVIDGTDAVMLSGETANGKYPVLAISTMNNIILRAEKELRTWQRPFSLQSIHNVSDAVSHAAMNIAEDMRARVIISLTRSGSTARMVSKYRPLCPVIAATPWVNTWRELALLWGVYPIMREEAKNAEEAVESALAAVVEYGVAQEGDLVVITAGVPVGIPGTTNMVEVHTIGRILVKGRSLIKKEATGHVKLAKSPREADEKIMQGDILVVTQTNKNYIPAMRKAAAIITEEGGLTSHAAIVALELGIPCVVSAKDCMKLLQDDMIITVDGTRGVVYQGRVKLH